MDIVYEVGDCVELIRKSTSSNPPVGTKGFISSLYNAMGGRAAQIVWDETQSNGTGWHDKALLKDLKLMETEIDESDECLDVLFSG